MIVLVIVLAIVASLPFCRMARLGHTTVSASLVCVISLAAATATAAKNDWSFIDWMPLLAFVVLPLMAISRAEKPSH